MRTYKQNDMYVAELDDTEWYGSQTGQREVWMNEWKDRAVASVCSRVVAFVTPDPLFPICEDGSRHKVFEFNFPAADEPFKVRADFSGEISEFLYSKLSEKAKLDMVRTVRDRLNEYADGVAGRYEIKLDTGKILERGRV